MTDLEWLSVPKPGISWLKRGLSSQNRDGDGSDLCQDLQR